MARGAALLVQLAVNSVSWVICIQVWMDKCQIFVEIYRRSQGIIVNETLGNYPFLKK